VVPRIALLSTSDTDLLSARASGADYVLANPARSSHAELGEVLEACDLIVARILGSPQLLLQRLPNGSVRRASRWLCWAGNRSPDAALMELSTVSMGVAADAHVYLAQGGPGNLRQLHAFLCETVLLTGAGFEAPLDQPVWGALSRPPSGGSGPRIGILFYRAQYAAGNIAYVQALADAVDAAGGIGVPIFATSLRDAPSDRSAMLGGCDALITTVLAAGGTGSLPPPPEDEESMGRTRLAALDIPIPQGLCPHLGPGIQRASDEGMTPSYATQVAIPEFDGRIITVPFSFKETDADGMPAYVADHERCRRVAEIAVNHGRLRHIPVDQRRIAVVLSAYPTKHSRIGNAVGLDTPVSVIKLLRALRAAGYDLGAPGEIPGTGPLDPVEGEHPDTTAGNALVHALIAAGGQDPEWLTAEQLSGQPVRIPAATYRGWLAELPDDLSASVTEAWGEAPGELFVDRSRDPDGEIVAATLQAGNVVILVQPPRGFGENPIAIYHDPDLAPSHHYLAVYRWLEREFGAHAVIHVGKHGNLEWLPGKNLGMSASCGTDAAIGSLPLIYPFLVNDPGEGTQAKRRAHATIVDHLIPPMARAETYGDIARLEQLLDEYAQVNAMDPAKAPALRGEIWTLVQAAQLDHDLGLDAAPDEEVFDEFVLHVDGWLCEIKDAQIRDGLHVLGQVPTGEGLINLVLAVLRSPQIFGGEVNGVPGLRTALGLGDDAPTADVDASEAQARELILALAASGWSADAIPEIVATSLGAPHEAVASALRFACKEVVPRLARTGDEITAIVHALDGGYVPAGPSGSPLRGLINVLPTGRNFYSVDPKAIPSRLAYQTGQAMAESLLQRHLHEAGEYPQSVGLSVWGTSAMRTSGDDIAEVLALLGVIPIWDEASRRVVGLEAIDLAELDRPRIDVTVRISGFFRDAFPHVVAMLDDAVRLVAERDEPGHLNYVRRHAMDDLAAHGDQRRATTRIFGSKPGSYGAGILPLIEAGNWRNDHDLAEVYTAWGGFAYGRDLDGMPARETWKPTIGGSRWLPRTSIPASTTSPIPTITSNTTAGWSRPSAR
jgi:cobaltochelatase CobN